MRAVIRGRRGGSGVCRLAVIACAVLAAGCGGRSANEQEPHMVSESEIDAALERYRDELLAVPGVVGAGRGECDGRPCIRVFVTKETPELREAVLSLLEGYPVEFQRTGRFQARDTTEPDP